MWAWLYLALGGIAMALTWSFAVREESIIFAAGMAAVSWALLALEPELALVTDSGTTTIAVGPARWLFAALALLSLIALSGAMLGVYPESSPDQQFEVSS